MNGIKENGSFFNQIDSFSPYPSSHYVKMEQKKTREKLHVGDMIPMKKGKVLFFKNGIQIPALFYFSCKLIQLFIDIEISLLSVPV